MSKNQTFQLKDFRQLSQEEHSKSDSSAGKSKVFHPYGSNQDSCMLDGSPSLSFRNMSCGESINSDAEDAPHLDCPNSSQAVVVRTLTILLMIMMRMHLMEGFPFK